MRHVPDLATLRPIHSQPLSELPASQLAAGLQRERAKRPLPCTHKPSPVHGGRESLWWQLRTMLLASRGRAVPQGMPRRRESCRRRCDGRLYRYLCARLLLQPPSAPGLSADPPIFRGPRSSVTHTALTPASPRPPPSLQHLNQPGCGFGSSIFVWQHMRSPSAQRHHLGMQQLSQAAEPPR